jgi:transglutaminase-like putative cysteine protease
VPLLAAALDLTARIHRDFKYDTTATKVTTPVEKVFEEKRGVCQHFAHLQIACWCSLGLAARYVSGYLRTFAPANRERLIGADARTPGFPSIVRAWAGDLDPTNNLVPSHHSSLGRDYSDVSPIRGVIQAVVSTS